MLLIIPHLSCNISCKYCYERHHRKKYKCSAKDYDLDILFKKMTELKNDHSDMCLHGGEPLLIGKKDVDKILSKMHKLTGKTSIQTNGTLIDDDFIKIFKKYSTDVGLSHDGPEELSRYRLGARKNTLDEKIKKMVKAGVNVGIITVVSKSNAGNDKLLNKLKKWILWLDKMKMNGRLNPCGAAPDCELSPKRIKEVYLDLAKFCLINNLKWSPFIDMVNGLQGKPRVCTFMGCDFFHTSSAAELLGDGSVTNCMRANEADIVLRHPAKYDTRTEILSQTRQEFGGCQGCEYWEACYGGCPSMSIDGDWRNKDYLCPLYKDLFSFYTKTLSFCGFSLNKNNCSGEKKKQSIKPDKSHGIEHGDSHGDRIEHGDSDNPSRDEGIEHGDSDNPSRDDGIEHGDSDNPSRDDGIEHRDSHGDRIEHGDSHGDRIEHGDSDNPSRDEEVEHRDGIEHGDSDNPSCDDGIEHGDSHGDRIEHGDSHGDSFN